MSDTLKKQSPVIHVKIKVATAVNRLTGAEEYFPTYHPEVIPVTEADTILNFKLEKPTPDDVIITSVTASPEDNDQLSTPSISKNGKQCTLSDVNTAKDTLNLNFQFGTKATKTALRISAADTNKVTTNYPEILNEPP